MERWFNQFTALSIVGGLALVGIEYVFATVADRPATYALPAVSAVTTVCLLLSYFMPTLTRLRTAIGSGAALIAAGMIFLLRVLPIADIDDDAASVISCVGLISVSLAFFSVYSYWKVRTLSD